MASLKSFLKKNVLGQTTREERRERREVGLAQLTQQGHEDSLLPPPQLLPGQVDRSKHEAFLREQRKLLCGPDPIAPCPGFDNVFPATTNEAQFHDLMAKRDAIGCWNRQLPCVGWDFTVAAQPDPRLADRPPPPPPPASNPLAAEPAATVPASVALSNPAPLVTNEYATLQRVPLGPERENAKLNLMRAEHQRQLAQAETAAEEEVAAVELRAAQERKQLLIVVAVVAGLLLVLR